MFDTVGRVNQINVSPEKLELPEHIWKQILHRWREKWEVNSEHLILIKQPSAGGNKMAEEEADVEFVPLCGHTRTSSGAEGLAEPQLRAGRTL